MEADRLQNALPFLRILGKKTKPIIDLLSTPRNTCMALERMKEAAQVMERVIARDAKLDYLYNGGVLWLRTAAPDRAFRIYSD